MAFDTLKLLPIEMWVKTIELLSLKDRISARLVSKDMKEAADLVLDNQSFIWIRDTFPGYIWRNNQWTGYRYTQVLLQVHTIDVLTIGIPEFMVNTEISKKPLTLQDMKCLTSMMPNLEVLQVYVSRVDIIGILKEISARLPKLKFLFVLVTQNVDKIAEFVTEVKAEVSIDESPTSDQQSLRPKKEYNHIGMLVIKNLQTNRVTTWYSN